MIRTLKTGTLNNEHSIHPSKGYYRTLSPLCPTKGFTLLELIAVIAILGTVLVLVFPRLSILEDLTLKSEVRRMAGLFRYLNEAAYTRKIYYRVSFYPEEESLTVESSPDGFEFSKAQDVFLHNLTLREGTDIEDIIVQGLGKIRHGSVTIIFNPGIGAEAFNLHLKKNDRAFTISYNPYSGKVKVTDGYV